MDLNTAIHTLEEVSREDLEDCAKAIRAEDKGRALEAIERVFAKVDSVIDILRSQSG